VGSLIAGFNAMLDRLQHEASREQERVASDRAAAAQRQLIEAIPVVISVMSEADGRVLYSNMDSRRPPWLSVCNADSPGENPGAAAPGPIERRFSSKYERTGMSMVSKRAARLRMAKRYGS
jgi:hypothetical protein